MGYLDSIIARLFGSPSDDIEGFGTPQFVHRKSASSFSKLPFTSSPPSSSASSVSSSASSFWMPRSTSASLSLPRLLPSYCRTCITKRQLAVLLCLFLTAIVWVAPPPSTWSQKANVHNEIHHLYSYNVPITDKVVANRNPTRWLGENSNNKHAISQQSSVSLFRHTGRPRGALVSLVRNSELEGIMQSMRQLEYHWNDKYQYPWVFFNDEPFSDTFKAATRNLTSADCYYELLPKEHWSLPDWVDEGRFMNSLEYLGTIGVGKGWMVSYRHMCRWNSGFFYKHPRLKDFDWYWRVEPDVHFFCNIDYDVFRFMRDNNMKYGFNMNILDDARSFPSLWSRTRSFINAHPELIHPDADLDWLLDSKNGGDYNNCQFFSNFEIGSLEFFRGEANEKYFDWLDRGGGFYYERFGDAPIHTLSVAMFVPKDEIWYFGDIGYQHDINRHCPPHSAHRCNCEPTKIDENFYKLVPLESPQKKPEDTCIRQFLGGQWLKKNDGYDPEAERAFGGDGYQGYMLTGLE